MLETRQGRGVLEVGLSDARSSPVLAATGADLPFRIPRGDGTWKGGRL